MGIIILLSLALILSWASVYLLMPTYIRHLKAWGANQEVSEYALQEFKDKAKTPIMGGLLFVFLPLVVCGIVKPELWFNPHASFVILAYILYGLIGFVDDFLILLRHDNKGLSVKKKLILQFFFAFLLIFIYRDYLNSVVTIPLVNISFNFGWLFYPLAILLFASEANAVNFTDGMDGLCAGVSSISLSVFLFIYLWRADLDLATITIAIIGGLIAYLHYNQYPAKVFMGDSGSLALGGLFASLSLISDSVIIGLIAGGIFVWEMACVVLQLSWVKIFHKRLFSYTPIHYAFKLKGICEKRIVNSFYIIAAICALVAIGLEVIG